MKIRLILIEKQNLLREAIRSLLAGEEDLDLVTVIPEVPQKSTDLRVSCDVMIIEAKPVLNETIEVLKRVRALWPQTRVIVISDFNDGLAELNALLENGATGYMTKLLSKEELVHGVRKVMDQGIYICSAFPLRLLLQRDHMRSQAKKPEVCLTEREADVLALIAQGFTNREISDKLFVSIRTVESRRKNILEKTNTTNTATLMRYALQCGLIN